MTIRFLLTFTLLAALVGLSSLLGASPSLWTVGIIVLLSLFVAYAAEEQL